MRISDWSSDVCSSDLAGHRRDAGFLALEVERRRARCDLQLRQLGQQVEDFLGDAVAEVFVLGVATHVDEGQYGNGAAVAGLARRSWGRGGRGGREIGRASWRGRVGPDV